MKYTELLLDTNRQLRMLSTDYSVVISNDSWIYEAIRYVENLLKAINNNINSKDYFCREDLLYEKSVASLYELTELNNILDLLPKIEQKDRVVLIKKLKVFSKVPLLLMNEDNNTNEGRNLAFELRLYKRLINSGYITKLSFDHPDILVVIGNREYAIECKRLFTSDSLITNIQSAINQLQQYSLLNKNSYGIVAISITRYLHSGDKRLEAITEDLAKSRIQYEMKKIFEENKKETLSLFPLKIPALIFEFTDRAIIDKPYSINLLDVIETAGEKLSLFHMVYEDFKKLNL